MTDEDKFIFHEDEVGVYVFYAGMNLEVARQEIVQEGMRASLDEENSDHLLDNHSF